MVVKNSIDDNVKSRAQSNGRTNSLVAIRPACMAKCNVSFSHHVESVIMFVFHHFNLNPGI
jgi:hypothetical protein